ncbi:fumarylacetoacetate hydrolase family protein [Microbacterium sp. RD1]|uniref:fumarylacetoacetate hydrolase family protein n=1 Tax=Microbacterium sp. RD1 TaxID=3457313 RepID=UPI003FA555AE
MANAPRTASWALAQYEVAGVPTLGILADGLILRAPEGLPATAIELLDRWRDVEPLLRRLDPATLTVVPEAEIVAPITYPRKVICAGANYYDHAAEMGTARPDPVASPFFFLKAPTTTVIGPYADIAFPLTEQSRTDWEVELGVVIADRCANVSASEAMSHVAGYVVANDVSARGFFARPEAVQEPFRFDWIAHKSLDASCPLGPGIIPAWQIADPGNLEMTLDVNGEVKQRGSTAGLVIGIERLIAGASRLLTLEPGDVILTGTPAGVGAARGEWLRDGDVVTAEIAGIGRISNRFIALG